MNAEDADDLFIPFIDPITSNEIMSDEDQFFPTDPHFPRSTRTSNQIIISVLNLRRILHTKFSTLSNILTLPTSIIRTDTLHID
jgi:hypothetical protein